MQQQQIIKKAFSSFSSHERQAEVKSSHLSVKPTDQYLKSGMSQSTWAAEL